MHSQVGRKQFLITGAAGSTGTNAIEILTQQGHRSWLMESALRIFPTKQSHKRKLRKH